MGKTFRGWSEVAHRLCAIANEQEILSAGARLNVGQQASIRALAKQLPQSGVILADEVGMGKTRIAVEIARCVMNSGGRVAILVPPGLGFQWQDELQKGGIESRSILRSLWQYFEAWNFDNEVDLKPWFDESIVIISHSFTNWRLGQTAQTWRWALLPQVYAFWRQFKTGRFPQRYHRNNQLTDEVVEIAAKSISDQIQTDPSDPLYELAEVMQSETQWPAVLDSNLYSRGEALRPWLERAVGMGLGSFELIIIDEAHKSRRSDSGLSSLLSNVIQSSSMARKLSMTATPIELNLEQWKESLSRIGLKESLISNLNECITHYSESVNRLRQVPSNADALSKFKNASKVLQERMSPFVLRRDKREEDAVQAFTNYSKLPAHLYRRELEILIDAESLSDRWQDAICATEALSIMRNLAEDQTAKRARLTVGIGDGISRIIEGAKFKKEENNLIDDDNRSDDQFMETFTRVDNAKILKRSEWWLDILKAPFIDSDDVLFNHPRTLAAVKAIEEITEKGEKVLVFGRYTRPMQSLVTLLNAREMLRCLNSGRSWPQSKVFHSSTHSEESATLAACKQLRLDFSIPEVNKKLEAQYEELESKRDILRDSIISKIEEGFSLKVAKGVQSESSQSERLRDSHRPMALFKAFKSSIENSFATHEEQRILAMVTRALSEIVQKGGLLLNAEIYADAFTQLVNALGDRDEGDLDGDDQLDEIEANIIWPILKSRLMSEHGLQQGKFARLMYGKTEPHTRRLLQLAFNRTDSFPKVLVAQSMVGREGLNLHEACSAVILLHPEWNPGVVEQQIGRVDRVGSFWSQKLFKAIGNDCEVDALPRIDVMPIIFKGTYDEYHWTILRERWDELRAQLHGEIIPSRMTSSGQLDQSLLDKISQAAPHFSPSPFLK